jgi:acyl-CoA synthetase (NDP forming)
VPALPTATREQLAIFLPGAASTSNPVDMIASATAGDYGRAIEVLAACEEIDSIIVIFTPPLVTQAADVVAAIHQASAAMPRRMPVLSVFMSRESTPHLVQGHGSAIPHYPFPEDASRALARAAKYAAWLATPTSRRRRPLTSTTTVPPQ